MHRMTALTQNYTTHDILLLYCTLTLSLMATPRYRELLLIVETCQAATLVQRVTAPNVVTVACSQKGEGERNGGGREGAAAGRRERLRGTGWTTDGWGQSAATRVRGGGGAGREGAVIVRRLCLGRSVAAVCSQKGGGRWRGLREGVCGRRGLQGSQSPTWSRWRAARRARGEAGGNWSAGFEGC